FKASKNLFDPFKVVTGFYVDWIAGGLIPSAGYNASDYMPVLPDSPYITNDRLRSLVYYTSSKTFISSVENIVKYGRVKTPANAAYIRVSLYAADNNINTFQFEQGIIS